MPFPTTNILDDANRADEGPPPSASWGEKIFPAQSGLITLDNTLASELGTGSQVWGTQFGPDCEVYCDLANPADIFALFFRLKDLDTSFDGYAVRVSPGDGLIFIERWDDGAVTTLGFTDIEVADGDSIGVQMVGDLISAFHKPSAGSWTLLLEETDSTYTNAGYIGLRLLSSAALRLDNLGGGNAVVPITGVSLFRGCGFPAFDDEEINRFEFWSVVTGGAITVEHSSSLLPSGAVTHSIARGLIGAQVLQGLLRKQSGNFQSGTETPMGVTALQPHKPLTGLQAPVGSLAGSVTRTLTGSLNPAGLFIKRTSRNVSGMVIPTGNSADLHARALAGSLVAMARLTEIVQIRVFGTLVPVGLLATLRLILQLLVGALNSSGAIERSISKLLTASQSLTGETRKSASTFLAGTGIQSATLATLRAVLLSLAGAVVPVGTFTQDVGRVLVGTLTPTGGLSKFVSRILGAVLSLVGSLLNSLLNPVVKLDVTSADFPVTQLVINNFIATSLVVDDSAVNTSLGDSAL